MQSGVLQSQGLLCGTTVSPSGRLSSAAQGEPASLSPQLPGPHLPTKGGPPFFPHPPPWPHVSPILAHLPTPEQGPSMTAAA